jgi:hypothetical protein
MLVVEVHAGQVGGDVQRVEPAVAEPAGAVEQDVPEAEFLRHKVLDRIVEAGLDVVQEPGVVADPLAGTAQLPDIDPRNVALGGIFVGLERLVPALPGCGSCSYCSERHRSAILSRKLGAGPTHSRLSDAIRSLRVLTLADRRCCILGEEER